MNERKISKKKIEKSYWQIESDMIIYNTLLHEATVKKDFKK